MVRKMTTTQSLQCWMAPLRWLQKRTQRNGLEPAAGAKQAKEEHAKAIAELRQYSDRDLADLGLHRAEIEHAVRHGRAGIPADAQTAA
jgi:Domain of unknown function (DUF1127)